MRHILMTLATSGLVLLGTLAGCSSSGGGGGDGGTSSSSSSSSSGDGGGSTSSGDGGASSGGPTAKIQFMNVFGTGGSPTAQDLFVLNYPSGAKTLAKSNLQYGETAEIDVPVNPLGGAVAYSVDVGVPDTRVPLERSMTPDTFNPATDPGRFTIVYRDGTNPGVILQYQKFTDTDPAYAPPAGKAAFKFLSASLFDVPNVPTGLAVGLEGGPCFNPDDALNEVLLPLDPGAHTLVVYDASSSEQCKGPVVAKSAPVTVAAGDTYLMVPVGEKIDEMVVKPLKLRR